jgi:hypothetical protein
MEPRCTVTLTVQNRDGGPGLLVKLPDGELFNVPLTQPADVVAGLVRDLAGLVVAHARQQLDAVAEALGAVAKGQ